MKILTDAQKREVASLQRKNLTQDFVRSHTAHFEWHVDPTVGGNDDIREVDGLQVFGTSTSRLDIVALIRLAVLIGYQFEVEATRRPPITRNQYTHRPSNYTTTGFIITYIDRQLEVGGHGLFVLE
ncbi:hypothetical protein FOZ61_006256 [Perkinsus olseni]|uniref:Uncharacterized protein n=1 Tax=Perkinsus olseni TaxID=32597 RepID=A0A7J6LE17_PEROL|nr:hypothetical protein FOZ61_006256 [Perkinsus olseni]